VNRAHRKTSLTKQTEDVEVVQEKRKSPEKVKIRVRRYQRPQEKRLKSEKVK